MNKEEIKLTLSKEELEIILVGVGDMILNFAEKDYSVELELTAEEYFKFGYIPKEKYDNFLKFSIIRNPVDRILSEINFQKIPKKNSKKHLWN